MSTSPRLPHFTTHTEDYGVITTYLDLSGGTKMKAKLEQFVPVRNSERMYLGESTVLFSLSHVQFHFADKNNCLMDTGIHFVKKTYFFVESRAMAYICILNIIQ
jgi:hypothetical protein